MGLAPLVHAGSGRRAPGHAVPGAAVVVPDEGRDGRLPPGVRRALRAARPKRRERGPSHARGRSVRADERHAAVRRRQRRCRDRRVPHAEGAAVRVRARPGHRAAPLGRLPPARAARGGGRARRGARQLRRRDRARRGVRAPGLALGQRAWRGPLPARLARIARGVPHRPIPPTSRALEADADRPQGRSEGRGDGRSADPGQDQGPRRAWRSARAAGRRRPGRAAAAERRPRARRAERHLVHRFPARLSLDRSSRLRRCWDADPRSRRRELRARPLLHGARVPVRPVLRGAPRHGPGREAPREADRAHSSGRTEDRVAA